ncbi:radical SAM family heme chaperone HemW [Lutispora saccharofermentans]|uniref:Heme chaperone HemW n=1 Tax=Lutispora saccharofermentans TaxID=3024236 RepID=A0ABT1NIS2_9FIRM|nr:radical SAM family heme chaperone HemW [Lutispora saccharofermentans]MCQ1531118.1 radical SAM family heme chaperone HemW [Lutispora saccharofermentans]
MIKRKHKVAILNYPLMDPRIPTEDMENYLGLYYHNADPWEVPVYIHIPFCSSICKFCIYNRQIIDECDDIAQRYTNALVKEIMLYSKTPYIGSLKIGAIFFGGGTPTCLSSKQIEMVMNACKDYLPVSKDVEITVESNPINANEEKVGFLSELGISRLSAGIQTFNPAHRKILSLKGTQEDVIEWIKMVKKYSFKVFAIDLMYGLPTQTTENWIADLKTALALSIDHFSLYELYVMAGSKLNDDIKSGIVMPGGSNEILYEMYKTGDKLLTDTGYHHHIVPEYNKPGRTARFWELTYDGYGDNLSFGTSSYGYLNGVTYQNIEDVSAYINAIAENRIPIQMVSSRANYQQILERTMVLALRRRHIEKKIFCDQYGKEIKDVFGAILHKHIEEGLITENEHEYKLTLKGEYLQGDVSVDYMQTTFRNSSTLRRQLAIGKHVIPDVL